MEPVNRMVAPVFRVKITKRVILFCAGAGLSVGLTGVFLAWAAFRPATGSGFGGAGKAGFKGAIDAAGSGVNVAGVDGDGVSGAIGVV